jgi:chaperonin GroEL
MNTLSANVVRNGLKLCQIEPPQFGYKRHELMNDIAVATGGKYFAEETGDDLNLIRMEDLGKIDKVIAGRDETIMIGGHGDEAVIKQRVKELKIQKDNTKSKPDVVFMSERIACLNGAIGVIYVGGNSDIEQKEKYDRVDDAVCAVRSALDEGILPGGGVTLWREGHKLLDGEDQLAGENLSESMKAPFRTIMMNAGLSNGDIMEIEGLVSNSESKMGYDVKDGMFGDMYKMGILDPLKVTKNALKNAVSVATTILSTNAIITMAREIK